MIFLLGTCIASPLFGQGAFANFESKQTRPIRLSPDGTKLFAVNTPDARLSVFDVSNPSMPVLIAEIPVGLEPVSVNSRTDDEIWVVNEVSDSISIISLSQHLVIDTLYVKDEPADVVFANGRAFVSAARSNQIRVFDAVTRAAITNISLVGENPRALAVNANGTRVYAAFALSGNRTTLIPPDRALAQPAPTNPALPAAPQVGLIVDATNPTWAPSVIKYTMPDNDVVELDTASLAILRYFPRVGTVNLGIAVRPAQGDLYVANTDARNLVRFEPNVRGHIVENRISRINVTSGAVRNYNLNPGASTNNLPNLEAKTNALAQPTALVFGPSGAFMFVAAFGSDRVGQLDAEGNVVARIDLGTTGGSAADPRNMRGPRGLALGVPGSQRLYVLNRISNTISILDILNQAVVREIPVGSYDPTPGVIRRGRGFLYDARLSGTGNASCAACHVDAEMDLIAWDLGDPSGQMATNQTGISPLVGVFRSQPVHPMKGPMTTQTLRGLNGLDPLHWRGDRTNFLHFTGAFSSLLGGSLLTDADMQVYRAFIDTIRFQPNPNQNLNRTYPTSFKGANAEAGRNTFFNEMYQPPPLSLSCTVCHTGPPGPGSTPFIVDRDALDESQDFKVPQLRNVYQKLNITHTSGATSVGGFGIVHDGMDPDLFTFLSRPVFGSFAGDTIRKRNLEAFVQCFDTGTAPAVGYSRTIVNSNRAATSNDWSLLESQAVAGNIDLMVKGRLNGRLRGLFYQPGAGNYRTDRSANGPFTRTELLNFVAAGDTLTLMGVPPGTGQRMGIDRNLDGTLDGDAAAPTLLISRNESAAIVSWSTNASGFVLERAGSLLSPTWVPDATPPIIVGDRFTVTKSLPGSLFFRLREL